MMIIQKNNYFIFSFVIGLVICQTVDAQNYDVIESTMAYKHINQDSTSIKTGDRLFDNDVISINNKKNHENKIIREKKVNDSFIFPKWYRILNEYFDIIKNGEELFKYSNNESNFNNFNGITYIKGILGISLILSF